MRIGVDLGGTKIEAILLDAGGAAVARLRVPSPDRYEETLEAVAGLVAELEAVGGVADGAAARARPTVGVGTPGAISPITGTIKNSNSTHLIGRPLDADLAQRLGRPVRLMNDADCFALSEATDGAGAGASPVFGVILGTGVGGGIVVEERVLEGASRIAGEWGHNPLPWPMDDERPGPPCYCGRRGCVETFLSGPGMERDHRVRTGRNLSSPEIVEGAEAGDEEARATLERYHDRLARALAVVINIVDPEVVVLGGGMSNIPGLAEAVGERLPEWVFTDEVAARVVPNVHGDSSGVRGAAWLWPEGEGLDASGP